MSSALRGHPILIASSHGVAHTPSSLLRMPNSMTATSSMQRLWLVVLCLLMAAAVPCGAGEVEVIDRKPVANGAEVVLELVKDEGPATYYQYSYRPKVGVDWVFYRKLVRFIRPDDSENRDYSWTATGIDSLKFTDTHVSVFFVDGGDCAVVTLDTDAESPQVQEDRFYGLEGRLLGVDELELLDPKDSKIEVKNLKRGQDGAWRMGRIPYPRKSDSKVSFVPLPPMLEVLGLKLVKVDDGKAGKNGTADFRCVVVRPAAAVHRDALSTTEPEIMEWVPLFFYDANSYFEGMALRRRLKWLKWLHGGGFKAKAPAALPPTMAGGREFPLPSMIDVIWPVQEHNQFVSLSRPTGPVMSLYYYRDAYRPTAAGLPCFATDYDRTLAEISANYARSKEGLEAQYAKSLGGLDDVDFSTFIVSEMARAER